MTHRNKLHVVDLSAVYNAAETVSCAIQNCARLWKLLFEVTVY